MYTDLVRTHVPEGHQTYVIHTRKQSHTVYQDGDDLVGRAMRISLSTATVDIGGQIQPLSTKWRVEVGDKRYPITADVIRDYYKLIEHQRAERRAEIERNRPALEKRINRLPRLTATVNGHPAIIVWMDRHWSVYQAGELTRLGTLDGITVDGQPLTEARLRQTSPTYDREMSRQHERHAAAAERKRLAIQERARYYSSADLLERGWTRSSIKRVLGAPDKLEHYRSHTHMCQVTTYLWLRDRVDQIPIPSKRSTSAA